MGSLKGLVNGKIIVENAVIEDKILIYDDKIRDIIDKENLNKYTDIELIDVKGQYVSPGFIDIHIHGAGGHDTMEGTFEAIEAISKTIAKYGTTAFCPTTMTMDKMSIHNAFDMIKETSTKKLNGARVIGANMEGPFISMSKKGAQNAKFIVKPDYSYVEDYLDVIKLMTIAPEEDTNYNFIKHMKESSNVVLSIGHSTAAYTQAVGAIENGISHSTHTFNAMTPLNHREPGIVGACLINKNITCELITDNIHVSPDLYQFFIDNKGKENVILITDSMMAGGMPEGMYELGGQKVIVRDGSARLEDGVLAGSIHTLNNAVKNVYEHTDLDIFEVVQMASLNPARVIGIDRNKGSLNIGKDADITVFDSDFIVKKTIVEGNEVY